MSRSFWSYLGTAVAYAWGVYSGNWGLFAAGLSSGVGAGDCADRASAKRARIASAVQRVEAGGD